jgi:transcription termination factor Rho
MAKPEDIDPKEVEDGAAAELTNEPSESKAKDQTEKRSSVSSSDDNDDTGSDQLVSEEPADDPGPPPPESINLEQFQQRTVAELYELGASLGLRVGGIRSKHDLVFSILSTWASRGTRIEAEGCLEKANDGYGFLRMPAFNFMPSSDDVYIGANFIRDHELRPGHKVKVVARAPKERERFLSASEVLEVEGMPVEEWQAPPAFESLTAISPRERIILERSDSAAVSSRVVDLIAPLGKGQRGVIVAPPRGGKTIMLKEIAKSIVANHPEIELLILLLDERPEEVTDFEENVPGAHVYSSTFDETPDRHVAVAELVAERARRITELGKDAVILMDSLTRLARGYNGLISTRGKGKGKGRSGKGRTGSGGLDTRALPKARKIFNIARNAEEGGSLTMLATALIDTGSRADEVIFEEFKGSGNMEIELDRELLERRIYPAINIPKSGTRKDELLYHPDELKRVAMLRRQLAQRPGGEAMEVLIDHIQNSASNAELLLTGLK